MLTAEHQFGFHKLHSTEHAAVGLIDHVTKLMESSHTPSKFVICILILLKRLTLLSLDILLNKLKYYGFVGTEIKLLTNHPFNRKQYLKYKQVSV